MLVRSLPVLAYELVWFAQCASPAQRRFVDGHGADVAIAIALQSLMLVT